MDIIVINDKGNGALIDCVHLRTLKSVDNAPYLLRVTTKSFLKCDMVTEHQLSIKIENPLVSNLAWQGFLPLWVVPVM